MVGTWLAGWWLVGWLDGWHGTESIFLPTSCFVIWEICFLPLNTRCISLLVSGDICWSHFQLKPPLGSQLKSSGPTNCWTIKYVDQHHKRLNVFLILSHSVLKLQHLSNSRRQFYPQQWRRMATQEITDTYFQYLPTIQITTQLLSRRICQKWSQYLLCFVALALAISPKLSKISPPVLR